MLFPIAMARQASWEAGLRETAIRKIGKETNRLYCLMMDRKSPELNQDNSHERM